MPGRSNLKVRFATMENLVRQMVATIALAAATATSQAQNETALLCNGSVKTLLAQSGTVRYEKTEQVTTSLVLVPDVTIIWEGAPFDSISWRADRIYFNRHRFFERELISYYGYIDRMSGRADIRHEAISDANKKLTVDYDLFCSGGPWERAAPIP
jgi:hypothetical protein